VAHYEGDSNDGKMKCFVFVILAALAEGKNMTVDSKMPIHCPKMSVFGKFRSVNIIVHCRDPQKTLLCAKPRHTSHQALKSVQSFFFARDSMYAKRA